MTTPMTFWTCTCGATTPYWATLCMSCGRMHVAAPAARLDDVPHPVEAYGTGNMPGPNDLCDACAQPREPHAFVHPFVEPGTKGHPLKLPTDRCATCGHPREPHDFRHQFREPGSTTLLHHRSVRS